jgi:NADPH-dependent curcumin reductase CurA
MSASLPARTLHLAAHCDEGVPTASHFAVVDTVVDTALPPNALLLRALVFSADPYQRSMVRAGRPSTVAPGAPLRGFIAGRVEASTLDGWAAGDLFGGSLPLSTLQVATQATLGATAFWRLPSIGEAKISLGVGVLGMPGATAFGGLIDVLRPAAGETLLVTAASGAVGQLVCQLAKARGVRVIGTAGGAAKCALLRDVFGADVAIDHKECATPAALEAAVRAAAGPKGLHMVFENVGTTTFEVAFKCLGNGGRIAICGGIAAYGMPVSPTCAIDPLQMIYTAQRIEGFVCTPWLVGARGGGEWLRVLAAGVEDGSISTRETVFEGIEAWPEAFASLFTGTNTGKVVVRV